MCCFPDHLPLYSSRPGNGLPNRVGPSPYRRINTTPPINSPTPTRRGRSIARCGLVAQGLGIAVVDPVPARELTGLPIVLRPFRPEAPIETLLLRPAGRPPSRLAERLIVHLKAERDALADA